MKFYEFIRYLHNGNVEYSPFYWAMKGNNIVITSGKIGTNTLTKYADFSSDNSHMNLSYLLDLIYKKNYKINILIREPNNRFKAGIFQEICLLVLNENKKNEKTPILNVSNIEKWTDTEWVSNLEKFISDYIDAIISNNEYQNNILKKDYIPTYYFNFHIQNWLFTVKHLQLMFQDNKIKIWDYTEFHRLLSYMDCDISDQVRLNTSENKPFINEYLNAYKNMNENIKNKICMYLHEDATIWHELMQTNKSYISIFDRLSDDIT